MWEDPSLLWGGLFPCRRSCAIWSTERELSTSKYSCCFLTVYVMWLAAPSTLTWLPEWTWSWAGESEKPFLPWVPLVGVFCHSPKKSGQDKDLYKLLGMHVYERFIYHILLTYSFNHLFILLWMYGYSFYILSYNAKQLYLFCCLKNFNFCYWIFFYLAYLSFCHTLIIVGFWSIYSVLQDTPGSYYSFLSHP